VPRRGIADEFGAPIKALPWERRHEVLEGAAMVRQHDELRHVGQPALDIRLDKLPKSALAAEYHLHSARDAVSRRGTKRGTGPSTVWACFSIRAGRPGRRGSASSRR